MTTPSGFCWSDCAGRVSVTVGSPRRRIAERFRWLRHEVAFDTAWLDWFPDQALRVAAGIPRKHASGGLWPSGHNCQRYEAFPVM